MGDIADDMLDGDMCSMCGEWLGDGDGFPTYCSVECARDAGDDDWVEVNDDNDEFNESDE